MGLGLGGLLGEFCEGGEVRDVLAGEGRVDDLLGEVLCVVLLRWCGVLVSLFLILRLPTINSLT